MNRLLIIGKSRGDTRVSHVNAHQRLTSAEEDFNDPFHANQPSSSPSQPCQRGYCCREEVMHGLSITDFHSPRPTWLSLVLSGQSTSSKDQHFILLPLVTPLQRFLFLSPWSYAFYWSRSVSSKGDSKMMPLNWKLILLPGHFGLLLTLTQQAKKVVTALVVVTDPDPRGGIGQLFHNGGKEEYVWNTGHSLGYLLVLPCPVTNVN